MNKRDINLLPQKKSLSERLRPILMAVGLVFVLVAAGAAAIILPSRLLDARIDEYYELRAEYAICSAGEEEFLRLSGEIDDMTDRIEASRYMRDKSARALSLLASIDSSLNADVVIETISNTTTSAAITGLAKSDAAIAAFVTNLSLRPGFESAQIGYSRQTDRQPSGYSREFSVTLFYADAEEGGLADETSD